jgi:Nucleotide-diphospho-sugar transferase
MYTCGVIYVASGRDYIDLACASAQTLRATNPGLPVDIFTDGPVPVGVFDRIHPLTRPGPRAKLTAMQQTRFARTLFLDADTLVVGDLGDVWRVLDRFDCAMAQDVRRASDLVQDGGDTPYAFPQYNSGVVLYRTSPAMLDLLTAWEDRFHATRATRDQPILKDLLWSSDIRLHTLPPEFNLRRVTELDAWEPLDARPVIIHSHRLMDHMPERYGAPGPRIRDVPALLAAERRALAAEWRGEDGTHPVDRFARAQARIARQARLAKAG